MEVKELLHLLETDKEVSAHVLGEAFEYLKEHDKEKYKSIEKKLYETTHGCHYNEEYAAEAVAKLHYTDKTGNKKIGPHWTREQVIEATKGYTFPAKTTDCDKYVAFNAAYADFSRKFDDQQVLDIAYLFFFDDEDWASDGKIWKYMNANQ